MVALVGNFDVRAHGDEAVKRFAFGGADVGGGDDAQFASGAEPGVERLFEDPQAVPFDEGAEEGTERGQAIGRGDLALDGVADRGLAAAVYHVTARRGWPAPLRKDPIVIGVRTDPAPREDRR